ncbi:hypothetical protein [Streptomyces celluloflavus]|uniref:hypothetical protein n=1 Tax=Streptomyces celluloflavus TaxID=58344 RepID=UPI003F4D2064
MPWSDSAASSSVRAAEKPRPRPMWWNFTGRNRTEIVEARTAWNDGDRFGAVHGYDGERLLAPELLPVRLKPRGRER